MLTLAPHCDTLVLFSGDGDFLSVLRAVQRLGCRVIVVSSQQTTESTVAGDLVCWADEFIDILSLVNEVCRQGQ